MAGSKEFEGIRTIAKLIWISVNPILQLILGLVIGVGIYLSRTGILTPKGSKIMAQVYIQALLPCLMLSKMAVAVNVESIRRMAVVVPFAIFYMLIGLVGSMILRRIYRKQLPTTFNTSLLVVGAWSNWGDIPLAVILNFTKAPPFEPEMGDLAVAYISVFIVIFTVSLFPFGGHLLVKKDFDGSDTLDGERNSMVSQLSESRLSWQEPNQIELDSLPPIKHPIKPRLLARLFGLAKKMLLFLKTLLTPVNIGIVLGLLIGLTPLKPLFILTPDNPYLVMGMTPPLNVIFTTCQFLGNACIPIGLLNLGGALSKLSFRSVPLRLSLSLSLLKLVITPAIAFPIVYALVHSDTIDRSDPTLQLVLMFTATVPSATTCLILTQFYNPSGEANHVASVLTVQYLLGSVTMIIWLTLANYLIFY